MCRFIKEKSTETPLLVHKGMAVPQLFNKSLSLVLIVLILAATPGCFEPAHSCVPSCDKEAEIILIGLESEL